MDITTFGSISSSDSTSTGGEVQGNEQRFQGQNTAINKQGQEEHVCACVFYAGGFGRFRGGSLVDEHDSAKIETDTRSELPLVAAVEFYDACLKKNSSRYAAINPAADFVRKTSTRSKPVGFCAMAST